MNGISDTSFSMQAQNAMFAGTRDMTPAKGQSIDQLRKVAEEFEAVFIGQMLQPLFANLGAEEPFSGGESEKMWRTMQVDEYGKAITRAGGIGLTDTVLKEMIKLQESQLS
ncbi:MAG: rod-binding protein [Rhodospirillales bacterium]|nr:rod-binding protein [Rhodospirillales bacterium]